MDYYDLLGVKRSASADELKTAYKRQAMKNHPDKGGDPEKFKKINEAYQALSDPQQKQMYDQFGTTDPQQAQMNSREFRFTTGSGTEFDDILRHFGFGNHFGQGFNQRMRKNKDVKLSYQIHIKDVYTGKTETITYKLPSGKIEVLDLKIPPGVKNQDQVKFTGYGDNTISNLPRGDLVIQIIVVIPREFKREGNNIYMEHKLDVLDLILGIKCEITTPENKKVTLTVPPGTNVNTIFSLSGYGLPDVQTGKRGTLFVEIKGLIRKLDEHKRKLLQDCKEKIDN